MFKWPVAFHSPVKFILLIPKSYQIESQAVWQEQSGKSFIPGLDKAYLDGVFNFKASEK